MIQQSLSTERVYLNKQQQQIYTESKIKKILNEWIKKFLNDKMPLDNLTRLRKSHFSNLIELPKYEIIDNKKHSIQCSYAVQSSCHCWCKGIFHGKAIIRENES
jgi:hypothetical protein